MTPLFAITIFIAGMLLLYAGRVIRHQDHTIKIRNNALRVICAYNDVLLIKLASADLQNAHLKKLCYGVAEETGIPFKPGVLDKPLTSWACTFCGYRNTINVGFCGRCDRQAV